MPEYDGSVKIGVSLDTKKAEKDVTSYAKKAKQSLAELGVSSGTDKLDSKMMKLVSDLEKAADKADIAKQKLDNMGQDKKAVDVSKIDKQLDKIGVKINDLNNKWDLFNERLISIQGGSIAAPGEIERLDNELGKVQKELEPLEAEYKKLIDKKREFLSTQPVQTPAEAKQVASLKQAEREFDIAKQKVAEYKQSQESSGKSTKGSSNILINFAKRIKQAVSDANLFGKAYKKAVKVTKKALSTLKSAASSVFNALKSGAKKSISGVTSHFGNFDGTLKKSLKLLLKYGFGIKSLFILFKKLKSSVVDGYKNLATAYDEVNAKTSEITTALQTLKNQAGAVFQPLIKQAVPIIKTFIQWVTKALKSVTQLFAALTGQDYWYEAVDVQKDFVDNTDKSTKATKKATKELERYLSPLDDINKFQDSNTKNTNDSTSNTDKNADNTSKMFKVSAVSDRFKNLAKQLKQLVKSSDWTKLGATIANKINDALTKIDWTNIDKKLQGVATRIYTLLNGFITNLDWDLVGKTISNGIRVALDFTYSLVTNLRWDKLGEGIGKLINSSLSNYNAKKFAKTLSNLLTGILTSLTSLISTIKWQKVSDHIVTFLSNVRWNNISNVVIGLVKAISKAITKFNFKSVGDALRKGIGKINWQGLWRGLTDVTTNTIQALADFFGLKNVNTSKLNNSLKKIYTPISNIWSTLKKTVSKLLEPIINDLIPALIDVIGEILKALDPVITAITPVMQTIIKVITRIVKSLTPALSTIGGLALSIVKTVSPILDPILNLIAKIVESLSPAIEGILGFIKGIFDFLSPISELVGGIITAITDDGSDTISAKLQEELDNLDGVKGDLDTVKGNIDTAITDINDTLKTTKDDIQYVDDLKDRMDQLLSKSTLTDADMQELNTIADLISEKYPEFKDTWDKMTKKNADGKVVLTKNNGEVAASINNIINKLKKQYATEALREQYKEAYKQQIQNNKDLASATAKVEQAKKDAAPYQKTYNTLVSQEAEVVKKAAKAGEAGQAIIQNYKAQVKSAKENMDKYNSKLKDAETALYNTKKASATLDGKMKALSATASVLSGKFKNTKKDLQNLRYAFDEGFISEKDLKNKYKLTAKQLYNSTKSLAENIDAGFKKGLSASDLKNKRAEDQVNQLFGKKPIESLRKEWGWHSPCKVMIDLGENVVKGFSNGLKNGKFDNVLSTIKSKTSSTISAIKGYVKGLPTYFKNVITSIWKNVKSQLNTMIKGFETFFNHITDGLNSVLTNLNSVNTSVGKTTKKTYIKYSPLPQVAIPKLATGAVIPPNKEFMAILGDQKQGTNIETPESLLRQVIREENTSNKSSNNYQIDLKLNGRTLTSVILDEARGLLKQTGLNPFELT